jgi:PAS domain S-box-containing protein
LYEENTNRLQTVATTGDTATVDSIPDTGEEMAIFQRGEIASFQERQGSADHHCGFALDSGLFVPLGEYGLLLVGWETATAISDETRELFETVCRTAEAAFERVQRERVLSELNAITQKLVRATSAEDAARIATDAGSTLLDLPFTHVYLRSSDGETLRPAAVSDAMREQFDDLPKFERGEGVFWDVLEAGDTRLYGDVQAEANVASEMPFRGAIIAALGSRGVFASGSLAPAELDAFDRRVVSILVATTDAVLERLEREQRLEEHEQELETARDRFRSVFENSNDAVVIFDPETDEILEANPRASELLGYPHKELLALGPSDIHPKEWEQFQAFVDTIHTEGNARTDRLSCVTKSGEQVPAEISASTLEFEGRSAVLALIRDVSELHEYERKLERQNDRLETFAESVSHDLRNPLNVATGYVELAREGNDSESLTAAHDALTRMDELIEDILTLARQRQSELELMTVALSSLADTCWQNVATEESDFVVTTDMTVQADEARLQRVFENLFRNAVEHGSTSSRTQSDDAIEHSESGVTIRVGELPSGDGFYVADTGPGIPEDERDSVFERGHTTAEDGTGFGLSIVREIVEAHGWNISVVESTDGGARFEITGVETVS